MHFWVLLGRPGRDGPVAETVEQIGGFDAADLPDLETAVELAKLLPQEHLVEVRTTLGIEV